jgi:hypothetical protein
MTTPTGSPGPSTPSRDAANWAKPVDRLSAEGVAGKPFDTVTGKRVSGPLQGFGQLWQKTFRVALVDVDKTPQTIVAEWKANFPSYWPGGARFYAPLDGIAPGEVALLDVPPVPGSPIKLSTGVMVIYADDESFTFMTPEGHTLSAWITFSAAREGDTTVAQVHALERASDPLDEMLYVLGANRINDRFWRQTLENLARSHGVATPAVQLQKVCVDKHRQWKHAGNIRNSATITTARKTLTAPFRWLTRRG